MKTLTLSLLTGCVLLITGCSNSGAFLALNQTVVNLEEGNYEVHATNVQGQATTGYILGLTYSSGPVANSLAIARVSGSGAIYTEALEDLWASYEAEHGSVEGHGRAHARDRHSPRRPRPRTAPPGSGRSSPRGGWSSRLRRRHGAPTPGSPRRVGRARRASRRACERGVRR